MAKKARVAPTGNLIFFPNVLVSELTAIDGTPPGVGAAPTEADVYTQIHGRSDRLPALCLSGGGIRSATFSLGILQGLAKQGLLDQFKYLSTVSGGGYIGSWLTAWIHRKTLPRVVDELAGRNLDTGEHGTVLGEAPPILQLRRYCNYLAPQNGLLSADLWSLIATILRNIILNWLVLIPMMLAALAVPRLMAAAVVIRPDRDAAWGLFSAGFVLCVWTIAYVSRQRILLIHKRPAQGEVLALAVVPVCIAAILLTIGWAWWHLPYAAVNGTGYWWSTWVFSLVPFGTLVMSAAWVAYTISVILLPRPVDPDLRPRALERAFEFVVYALIGAIAGIILRVASQPFDDKTLQSDDVWPVVVYATVAAPAFLLSFTLAATIFVGLFSSQMSEEDREWWSRFGAWALIAAVVWTVASVVVLLLPQWIAGLTTFLAAAAATLGTGAITVLGGLSARTIWKPSGSAEQRKAGDPKPAEDAGWLSLAVTIALPLFVVLFAVFLSLLTDLIISARTDSQFSFRGFADGYLYRALHLQLVQMPANVVVVLMALLVGGLASRFVGINMFSLHAMYRNRLIRAYLGASRGKARHPDKFIGFDPNDDIVLCNSAPEAGRGRPLFHVINMALNLVSGDELAWQDRKAESMTATPLHVGSPSLGYRLATEYGGDPKTLTIGTAMAISGAAASPNMGYHSSPVLTFVLTLFNARLGWWLGNPGKAGQKTYTRESPKYALRALLSEAFGLTDRSHPYVYASDGGHFEDLGLYEMVRRRCGFILIVDADADPRCDFEDLGDAVRKIRSDLGIPIELGVRSVFPRYTEDPQAGRFAITGHIKYSAVDSATSGQPVTDGTLIYIKPAFYDVKKEPLDVVNYAKTHPTFPHETTTDQFFSESQFESYRALGLYTIEQLCAGIQGPTLKDLADSVEQYLK